MLLDGAARDSVDGGKNIRANIRYIEPGCGRNDKVIYSLLGNSNRIETCEDCMSDIW